MFEGEASVKAIQCAVAPRRPGVKLENATPCVRGGADGTEDASDGGGGGRRGAAPRRRGMPHFLSTERPDLQYTAKEASRRMAHP